MPAEQHRADSPDVIRCSVITVSDTRTLETDRGGQLVLDYLNKSGHTIVDRRIVRDEPDEMTTAIGELLGSSQAI